MFESQTAPLTLLFGYIFFFLQVTIVDPLKLGEEFASILEDNILATNVSVKLILHTGL